MHNYTERRDDDQREQDFPYTRGPRRHVPGDIAAADTDWADHLGRTLPKHVGRTDRAVFELARTLKGMGFAAFDDDRLRAPCKWWLERAAAQGCHFGLEDLIAVVGAQIAKVRKLPGENVLLIAEQLMRDVSVPPELAPKLKSAAMVRLCKFVIAMGRTTGSMPFFPDFNKSAKSGCKSLFDKGWPSGLGVPRVESGHVRPSEAEPIRLGQRAGR